MRARAFGLVDDRPHLILKLAAPARDAATGPHGEIDATTPVKKMMIFFEYSLFQF
jgi:hypothetical protein